MFECDSYLFKNSGFDVKYTPEADKQTNKQIIAHRMK